MDSTRLRISRRTLVSGAAALCALGVLPRAHAQTPQRGGTLTIGLEADLGQLDPHKSSATITYTALSPIYQSLVDLGPNLELRPLLATSWTPSADGLTWTFKLRPNVYFHNGRLLTSRDVKFNIERIRDPKTGARGGRDLSIVADIATPDPGTVQFKLKAPFGVFPITLVETFQGIVAPEAFDGVTNTLRRPIGTGPFQFVEWRTNDRLTMRRFDRYWDTGKPYLDEVVIRPIPDETVRLAALQAGDIDLAYPVPQARLKDLFARPSKDYVIRLVRGGAGNGVIVLNTRRKPFDDVRVRQAVAYALNKQELVEVFYRGWGRVGNQNFAPISPWYLRVKDRTTDRAKAKALLAEAGLASGFKASMISTAAYGLLPVSQVFQAQMRQIGIDIDIQVFDFPTWIKRSDSGQFDVLNTSPFPKLDPDDGYYRYVHTNGGVWQLSGYLHNEDLDRLLDQGRLESSLSTRREIYSKAVQVLVDQASMLFFGSGDTAAGWRSHVLGFVPQMIGALSYPGGGVQDVWLSK